MDPARRCMVKFQQKNNIMLSITIKMYPNVNKLAMST